MEKNLKKNIYIYIYIYEKEYVCFQIHISEALCYIPKTNTLL